MLSPRRLHRLLRLCLPLAVTLLSIAAQTQAQDTNDAPALDLATVEAQIQSTQSRLQELDAQIQENRIRKATLEKTVASVTGKVAERAARLDDLAGEIKRYNKSLGKLEAQVAHEREQLLWRKQQLANSIRRQQHLSNSAGTFFAPKIAPLPVNLP